MSLSLPNKMFMSPDFLAKFLEQYRELPVLWQVRNADYSNRAKRNKAWNLLVQFTREKIPEADIEFLKKKVDSIRASFRKELRRVRLSERSGAPKDDLYKPTLWYFDLLLFTADQEHPQKSKSNLDEETEDVDGDELETTAFTATEDEARTGEDTQTSHEGERSSETVSQTPLLKRKKASTTVSAAEAQYQNLVEQAMAVLNRKDDEYDSLGKTYAAKLRRMPATQRDIADKLINDVLFKGLMNHLTPMTFISDYRHTSDAWVATGTSPPVSTCSDPTLSATPGLSSYPIHSPKQEPEAIFPPY